MEVAALYVERDGVYYGLPDVDPWDEQRDARKYNGSAPVVAHPPCSRWCQLAYVNQARYGHKVGDDGGCFEHALWTVLRMCGVLEHPAYSHAWKAFGLTRPVRGQWTKGAYEGMTYWVTEVSQVAYGHVAKKRTWLLYAGWEKPFDLDWSEPPAPAVVSWLSNRGGRDVKRVSKKVARATPPAFRDELLRLARHGGYPGGISKSSSNMTPP